MYIHMLIIYHQFNKNKNEIEKINKNYINIGFYIDIK